jgi:hypothetical protein
LTTTATARTTTDPSSTVRSYASPPSAVHGTQDVSIFVENRIRLSERTALLLRLEGFNIFNHGNYLGRGQTIYGDTGTPSTTFGQLVAVGTATNALPAFANVDPPRMFQLQARFIF